MPNDTLFDLPELDSRDNANTLICYFKVGVFQCASMHFVVDLFYSSSLTNVLCKYRKIGFKNYSILYAWFNQRIFDTWHRHSSLSKIVHASHIKRIILIN